MCHVYLKEFQRNSLKYYHKMASMDSGTQFKYSKGRSIHPTVQGPHLQNTHSPLQSYRSRWAPSNETTGCQGKVEGVLLQVH